MIGNGRGIVGESLEHGDELEGPVPVELQSLDTLFSKFGGNDGKRLPLGGHVATLEKDHHRHGKDDHKDQSTGNSHGSSIGSSPR